MSFAFERMIAGRYLRSRKKESFISVIAGFSFLGIMLGVATLIIVMSVMNGFRAELVGRILGLNGHMNVYNATTTIEDYDGLSAHIKETVSGVVSITPSIESQALLSVGGQAMGVVVRGLSLKDFKRKPILSTSLIEMSGRAEGHFTGAWISIGKVMAERYGISIGDKITLIAPKGKVTPFGNIPRSRVFYIGSIFDVGMYEYNASFVFMPLKTAQTFYQMGNTVSALEIMTGNPSNLDEIKKVMKMAVRGRASVADWRDTNASFYTALQVERNVMFLILTLIIIVAAFNIVSSLIMLVKDKTRDIAILRTMGATRGMIIRIFFYTGASIGVFGTFAGAALGIAFSQNIERIRRWLEDLTGTELFADEIYFLSKLPAKMDVNEVIAIILMALSLSFVAIIYPAWRAARLDPVEALRNG